MLRIFPIYICSETSQPNSLVCNEFLNNLHAQTHQSNVLI